MPRDFHFVKLDGRLLNKIQCKQDHLIIKHILHFAEPSDEDSSYQGHSSSAY